MRRRGLLVYIAWLVDAAMLLGLGLPRPLVIAASAMFVFGALVPVGYVVAGIATDRVGPATVFLVGGAIGMAVIALGLLHPAIRSLD